MKDMKVTAKDIVNKLAEKHWQDVFVAECKDGSSGGGHLRMDAWVMKKSWANPLTIGYEVKVSRQDFLNDEKWRGYLPYCNEFYFVCPSGLIQPDEIGDGIGLMWLAKTGTRLLRKKKAVYRDDLNQLDVYKYIIMCRSVIKDNSFDSLESKQDNVTYWRSWLEDKDENKDLGRRVGRKIRELVISRIDQVDSKNRILKAENRKLAHVKAELKKMGFETVPQEWQLDRKVEELKRVLPDNFCRDLRNIKKCIEGVLEKAELVKK